MASFFNKEKYINKVLMVETEHILANPAQPRKKFDQEELANLSKSIEANGILQPLTVRRLDNEQYELIAGERRLRAAKLAGCTSVPCLIVSIDERQSAVFALLENIQRQDLNFFEQAQGIQTLIETWGVTQEEASHKLGIAQSTIANKLRILKLSEAVKRRLLDAELTERHARSLLKLSDEEKQHKILDIVIERRMNVTQTDQYIEEVLQKQTERPTVRPKPVRVVKDVRIFFNTVTKAIDLMKRSGINAVAKKQESDEYIEFFLQIPKAPARASK